MNWVCHRNRCPTSCCNAPGVLRDWRDRLYQQYRVPFLLAALSDLKLGYVEIVNPLLSDSVIDLIRQLPDSLRTHKVLLRNIGRTWSGYSSRTIELHRGTKISLCDRLESSIS